MRLAVAVAAVVVGSMGVAWAAGTVVVTPTNLQGWQPRSTPPATIDFVNGPQDPPCGDGSAEFRIDPSGATDAQLRNPNYQGVRLANLTALEYSTFVTFNNDEQAVYIILNVDRDGDLSTTGDQDFLFFEPVYQDATFCPEHPQGDVVVGAWQDWDALNGCWYFVSGAGGTGPGGNVAPLDEIFVLFPDVTIINPSPTSGGVRLVAGFGGPTDWGNFIGNADCFTIGVAGDATTFDFEAAAADEDDDGVPDASDHCPGSDTRPKVDVNGTEPGQTSIDNTTDAQGCTIQDEVNQCRTAAKNHGQYVKCVGELSRDLESDGRITKEQGKDMRKAAAQSDTGKK